MRGHESERGATLVEYALLVALLAVVLVPTVGRLRIAVLDRYERGIVPGAGPNVEPGAPGTTAPPPTSPPSTAPPTTAPPTTAAPTTTTTRPPTTTTAPPVVAAASFGNVTSSSAGWFRWAGSADVVITDAAGRPLAGAQVEVTVAPAGGSPRTVTVTTDASGRATVEVGPYDYYGSWGGIGRADLAVASVTVPGGTWNGTSPTTTVRAP